MAMQAADIERLIIESLPDAKVQIQDLAGDGDHYAATVISEAFRGKTRVQQHQIVYAALKGRMGGELHALALTTSAPQHPSANSSRAWARDSRFTSRSVRTSTMRVSSF